MDVTKETSSPGLARCKELAVTTGHRPLWVFSCPWERAGEQRCFLSGTQHSLTPTSGHWSTVSGWDASSGASEHCPDLGPCLELEAQGRLSLTQPALPMTGGCRHLASHTRGHSVAGDKQRSKTQRQGEEEKDEEMGWVPATCFSVLFLFPDCVTRAGRAMFCSLGQKPCFVTLTDFPWLISAMTWRLRQSWGEA